MLCAYNLYDNPHKDAQTVCRYFHSKQFAALNMLFKRLF